MTGRKTGPVWDRPPGYFTEPCRRWWGNDWKPHAPPKPRAQVLNPETQEVLHAQRAVGRGRAPTFHGLSRKNDERLASQKAPGNLVAPRAKHNQLGFFTPAPLGPMTKGRER